MPRRPRIPATIVAFDGLIAATAAARALAVSEAVTSECSACTIAAAERHLPGRSLDEAVEAALQDCMTGVGQVVDATVRDLTVLRARRGYGAMVAQGLPLCVGARDWAASHAALHGRLVLRADSARREVERMLDFSGLADLVSFVRCADDFPRVAGARSLISSWQAIERRLLGQGVSLSACTAIERDVGCADVARALVAEVRVTEVLF